MSAKQVLLQIGEDTSGRESAGAALVAAAVAAFVVSLVVAVVTGWYAAFGVSLLLELPLGAVGLVWVMSSIPAAATFRCDGIKASGYSFIRWRSLLAYRIWDDPGGPAFALSLEVARPAGSPESAIELWIAHEHRAAVEVILAEYAPARARSAGRGTARRGRMGA